MEHHQDLQAMANSKTHRWLLQGLLCICFAGRGFLMVGFTAASQTISEYFQCVTIHEYEMLSGFGYIFGIPVAAVIAGNGTTLRPRQLAIASSSILLLSAVLSSVGFMSTSSFWLVVLGWIAAGIASAIIFVTPIIMADMSFSSDFAVVTYGLAFASMHLGSASSHITFTKLTNAIPDELPGGQLPPKYLITETFVRGFGVMTLILFTSTMLVCLCFNDGTIYPQEHTEDDTEEESTKTCLWSGCFANFRLRRLLRPFEEAHFMLLLSAIFFLASAQTYSFLRMPDILSYLHPTITPNTISIIYAFAMFCGIIGCCIATYVTMRFSRPRLFSTAGSMIALIFSIGLYASCHMKNFIGASTCSVLISLSASYLTISLLVDFLLLCERQSDRITMVTIYFACYNTGMMLFSWCSILFCNLGIPEAFVLLIIATLFPIPIMVISTKWSLQSSESNTTRESTSSTDSINETTFLTASIR